MKSRLPLALERDRSSMVLDTGHHVKYIQEKQVQQLRDTSSDLNRKCSRHNRLPEVKIQRSNDREGPVVLDPGKNLTPGVGKFHVEHEALGREAGHVVTDEVRCLRDYQSGIRRFWSQHLNLDLYRCSITEMVNYSLCVVAVEVCAKPFLNR